MGTRGAYGFRIGGADKVTYNHFDSYPDGLGLDIVRFIQETDSAELVGIALETELVDLDSTPTAEQIAKCRNAGTVNLGVSEQSEDDWYCLLRGAQGELGTLREAPYMIEGASFLADSLFCEWAYIINLDAGTLEIYKGFNKNPLAAGRYAETEDERDGYCGVALISTVRLDSVRQTDAEQFIRGLETD